VAAFLVAGRLELRLEDDELVEVTPKAIRIRKRSEATTFSAPRVSPFAFAPLRTLAVSPSDTQMAAHL
jgi:hypothetical protein